MAFLDLPRDGDELGTARILFGGRGRVRHHGRRCGRGVPRDAGCRHRLRHRQLVALGWYGLGRISGPRRRRRRRDHGAYPWGHAVFRKLTLRSGPARPVNPRRILLADADAFFVAVARMVDPDGAGKAPLLIVGGTRESRGVVCSASYEARKFGVRSAMPIARALRLCPQAMCVPIPRRVCSEKSREIRGVLEKFSPVVEGASIDEWYLDMGGTEALYANE